LLIGFTEKLVTKFRPVFRSFYYAYRLPLGCVHSIRDRVVSVHRQVDANEDALQGLASEFLLVGLLRFNGGFWTVLGEEVSGVPLVVLPPCSCGEPVRGDASDGVFTSFLAEFASGTGLLRAERDVSEASMVTFLIEGRLEGIVAMGRDGEVQHVLEGVGRSNARVDVVDVRRKGKHDIAVLGALRGAGWISRHGVAGVPLLDVDVLRFVRSTKFTMSFVANCRGGNGKTATADREVLQASWRERFGVDFRLDSDNANRRAR
jgi:hypothetical protein